MVEGVVALFLLGLTRVRDVSHRLHWAIPHDITSDNVFVRLKVEH